jgi:iron complex outermembrane recepter protein
VTSDTTSTSFGYTTHDVGDATFTSSDPRLDLDYRFSSTSMAYLSATKGFRSGGFNLTSAGGGTVVVPPTYAPDWVWTYEVGTKQQFLDRRVDLDVSVYRSIWEDVQSSFYAPHSFITIIENGGRVSGWGTDISLAARPVAGLTFSVTYGWNNLAYDTQTADKNVGDPVDGAVRSSYSASAEYRRPLLSTIGFVRVDYQYAGKSQFTYRDYGPEFVYDGARRLLNARLGVDVGRVQFSVYGTNLTNDRTLILNAPYFVEQRPRTVGLGATMQFQ